MARILLVDDDVHNLMLMESILRADNHETILALDGEEALGKVKSDSPDLIISDVMMPRMDGFELCRAVKSDEEFKNIPFVFYTAAYDKSDDEQFGLSLGAARFLHRSMPVPDFQAAIREVTSAYEEERLAAEETDLLSDDNYLVQHKQRLFEKLEDQRMELDLAHSLTAMYEREIESLRQQLEERDEEITELREQLRQ